MQKIAKSSMDYVRAAESLPKSTSAQRVAKLNQMKAAGSKSAAMGKIGQGFVGPIMMRLKYEGITRNILNEDIIAPGSVPVYDVADEMGKAYFIEPYQAEAVISQYEGKRVFYNFRHITAFPQIQEQDLLMLTIDMVDYAQNEAFQRIMEEEDGYLFALLDAAVENIDAENPDWAGQTSHKVEVSGGQYLPESFYDAGAIAIANRLEAHNIIMNPAARFDMMKWDLVATSVNFKDKTFDGVPITSFAGFNVFTSVICPADDAYVLPDSNFVGNLAVLKSLEVQEDNQAPRFTLGWVADAYEQLLILNSGGIVKVHRGE